jgi:hypothetical protein
MKTRIVAFALAATAALTMFACADSTTNQSPQASTPSTTSTTMNDLNKQMSAPASVNQSPFVDGGNPTNAALAKPGMTNQSPQPNGH